MIMSSLQKGVMKMKRCLFTLAVMSMLLAPTLAQAADIFWWLRR